MGRRRRARGLRGGSWPMPPGLVGQVGLGFTGAKGHGDNKQSSGWLRALTRASLFVLCSQGLSSTALGPPSPG